MKHDLKLIESFETKFTISRNNAGMEVNQNEK